MWWGDETSQTPRLAGNIHPPEAQRQHLTP